MEKKNSFESNLENLDKIIESLESGELSLDDSIKEYEKAMKLIKKSSEMLKSAEGKIIKVNEKNDKIEFSEVDDAR
ncbi:MAG: exodeoxyribonuclease VII small subunit [Fusobacteriaceae bacterium]